MKLRLCLMLLLLMFFIFLISCCAQEHENEAKGTPPSDREEASLTHERSSSSVSTYQLGFDKGYKVGYVTGYQTGSSDVLKNVTTNITRVFENLELLEKPPIEETKGERSLTEIYLSIGLLIFGFLLALLQTAVVIKKGKGWERNSIRLIGLTLVLTFGAVLLPVGYSAEQVTPLMTLLGIVAGYLLAGIDLH